MSVLKFLSNFCLICALLFATNVGYASVVPSNDEDKQIVRGSVVDQETLLPLEGVDVELFSFSGSLKVETESNGKFRVEGVSLGVHKLSLKVEGYEEVFIPEIQVMGDREVIIMIKMKKTSEQEASN